MLGDPVSCIRGRGNYPDHGRLQHCIRGRGGSQHSPDKKKQTDESANYILHVGVRFLGVIGRQVEQRVSLAVLAQAFVLGLTSRQNHLLQTFGPKPASTAGWDLQVFRRRVVW